MQTSVRNFQRVSPFNITPVKRAHKARTCWYRRPFRLKNKNKKTIFIGIDKHNIFYIFFKYKCMMANTSAIWQQAAHTTYHLLAVQQEPYKKCFHYSQASFPERLGGLRPVFEYIH